MKNIRQRTLLVLLMTVFVGVVFHAPISVWLGSLFPEQYVAIKAWKEVLLCASAILLAWEITDRHRWRQVLQDRLIQLPLAYMTLHFLLLGVFFVGWTAAVAGLLIDLRFIALFMIVYLSLGMFQEWRRPLIIGGAAAATVSLLFALLQVTVLPPDILSYIGYGPDSIAPYLTVDQNQAYVRINGTLRGPNPLGLYAVMIFCAAAAYAWQKRRQWQPWHYYVLGLLAVSLPALWFSYSRSALLAWGVAVVLFGLIASGARYWRLFVTVCAAVALIAGGVIWLNRDLPFVMHVIVHEDPDEGNDINSNHGHIESLTFGVTRMAQQPLGAGIGSAGSPSLMEGQAHIIENYYLYVAHETGWIGIGLFLWISAAIMYQLWRRRTDWLAVAVFMSGAGIIVAGLVLPVWADDTVAMVWWGAAGIALSIPVTKKGTADGRTIK